MYVACQLKPEGMLLVSEKFRAAPLHTDVALPLVITGTGFTVTVTICGVPGQLPVVDVGVTV